MKVLWFSLTTACYTSKNSPYNGGGWISSLQKVISIRNDIDLAIAFVMNGQPKKVVRDGVTYYPIENPLAGNFRKKLLSIRSSPKKKDEIRVIKYMEVVKEFKPDIIQVFGSESAYGLIAKETDIPVVLHIQGILTPYYNAFLPPMVSMHNYFCVDRNIKKVYARWKVWKAQQHDANREIDIIKSVRHFIGRTQWDKNVTLLYNPKADYHYGSEILRDCFYEEGQRQTPKENIIVSTISQPLYKGFDLILKSARLLKEEYGTPFTWKVFGNVDPTVVERMVHIRHEDVNVKLMGVASAEQLRDAMLRSTVYVHPSYIDNSPNSLCEAQICGLPSVGTYVGGVPSLINNGQNGFIVPANDPYQMAFYVHELCQDKTLNTRMGNNAKSAALKRHDKTTIVNALVQTYHEILKK